MTIQSHNTLNQSANFRIFALMSRLNIEANPVNYELFHEILSGANPELRQRFAALGKTITPQQVEDLARQYLPHHFGASVLDHSANVIRDDVEELLHSLQQSRQDLDEYAARLSTSSTKFREIDPANASAIKAELEGLAELTEQQKLKSEATRGTLDRKLESVTAVTAELAEFHAAKFTHPSTKLSNRRAFNKRMADLYETDRFPGEYALIFGKIRQFEALDRNGELVKSKEFLLSRIGQSVQVLMGEGDFAAWTESPHLALLLHTASEDEIERVTAELRQRFITAFSSVRRSAPHLPVMTISFGACTTYNATSASSLIRHAEESLKDALAKMDGATVIHARTESADAGRNYQLYGRSVTV